MARIKQDTLTIAGFRGTEVSPSGELTDITHKGLLQGI